MYVIKCTEPGKHNGKYVARPGGSKSSYTGKLEQARTWSTRELADRHRCPENEVVLSLADVLEGIDGNA